MESGPTSTAETSSGALLTAGMMERLPAYLWGRPIKKTFFYPIQLNSLGSYLWKLICPLTFPLLVSLKKDQTKLPAPFFFNRRWHLVPIYKPSLLLPVDFIVFLFQGQILGFNPTNVPPPPAPASSGSVQGFEQGTLLDSRFLPHLFREREKKDQGCCGQD